MRHFLDFEKPIADIEGKIEELRHATNGAAVNITSEIRRLEKKMESSLHSVYAKLSPWQKVQVARHPDRPGILKYIEILIDDFSPLAGDRLYGDDAAIIGGLGRFRGIPVVVMGHERGHDTHSRIRHNFGMGRPEAYRKAQRLMDMADRFDLPILTFVDTPGAYPGKGAEERGQAEAIAKTIEVCTRVGVPLITTITGEGGSGGAIALATANTVLMLENSVYSVISPEGCASILWRSAEKAKDAAEALRLTAQDLLGLGVIDEIIPETLGGAHRDAEKTVRDVGQAVEKHLIKLLKKSRIDLVEHRREKFLAMGQ